ncbi:VOC family protein [Lentisalinibacter salinarum]|uniref:VOC family protein n=1 Tax=Lentisalinibacter salinarum TaxID=2992239 RepID=UPI003868B448
MIGPIRCVTVTVPDLAHAVETYRDYLGYERFHDERLTAGQADYMGAPALAGADCALLRPAAGGDFCFRFITQPLPPRYRPLTTWGWNAAELIVEDVDRLAAQLEDSPFRIVGPPEDLSFSDAIRAMQIIGPAEEVLYLTMIKEQLPEFDLPTPACPVDRTFIVILGGPDMGAMQAFYHGSFGVPEAPVMEARISVLSRALDLPADTMHPIAAMPLAGQSLIEVDDYRAATTPRDCPPGGLPPGIAMVSFAADALPDDLPAGRFSGPPYHGGHSVLTTGAAGELVELIRT